MKPLLFSLLTLLTLGGLSPLSLAQSTEPPHFPPNTSPVDQQSPGLTTYCLNSSEGPSLHILAPPSEGWATIAFAPEGGYDFSAYGELIVPLTNLGQRPLTISIALESVRPGPPDRTLNRDLKVELLPGESQQVSFPLVQHTMPTGLTRGDFFGMRGAPFFHPQSLDLAHLTALRFHLRKAEQSRAYVVGPLSLRGEPRSAKQPPQEPFPFIDQFGQYLHDTWPGKTTSVEQLQERAVSEQAALEAYPRPTNWNRFGGAKGGTQHEVTGFFRTAKVDGKWTLIDPDGKAFFSTGVDHAGYATGTILNDRDHWFEQLPPDDEHHQQLFHDWKPNMPNYHFYDQDSRTFNFHRYNIMRKYGENWEDIFRQKTVKRLPSWGLNTLACWSDVRLFDLQEVPYVGFIKPRGPAIAGTSGHWGPFLDVFDSRFAASLDRVLEQEKQLGRTNDPWLIGYFVDNEISWGNTTDLAIGTLKSPPEQPAKKAFLKALEKKYQKINRLNNAWKTEYSSWEALAQSTTPPDIESARSDLEAFVSRLCNRYFRLIAEAIDRHAPNHLYLGCRLTKATKNPLAVAASSQHCDVVSFNVYQRHLADALPSFNLVEDKPIIIGEFHFGALDRGPLHTGLVEVANQEERSQAYYDYVTDCLAHPAIVGCHWFQYVDSPTTGRQWDGENYQIGFVDTADTPYPELITASRKIAEQFYLPIESQDDLSEEPQN